MKTWSEAELLPVKMILADLSQEDIDAGIARLYALKDEIYTAIPEKQRIGRGITWVVQQICEQIAAVAGSDDQFYRSARLLFDHLPADDHLLGVPVFLMGIYGARHLAEVLPFFSAAASSPDWVVREFAAGAFRQVIAARREDVLPWLQQAARSPDARLRRFVSESLRPVTILRWLNQQPEYSLSVLRLMFQEADPYPRTSVGNNLSDLSRRQPELIFAIVQELVATGNPNSYWIAYRACRNLVKKDPLRVMDLLGVEEYHYKDRNFYR
jgi:3-methyladenine DNA glycosylase AlkC